MEIQPSEFVDPDCPFSKSASDRMDYQYVDSESHEKEFVCPECELICIDPVIAPCCGKFYCRHCSRTVCTSCYVKRAYGELMIDLDAIRDRAVVSIISKVRVKCKRCGVVVERGLKGETFKNHFDNECVIECKHGCDVTSLTRSGIPMHDEVCPFVEVKCDAHDLGCDFVSFRTDINNHQKSCVRFQLASMFRKQQKRIVELENMMLENMARSIATPMLTVQPRISLNPTGDIVSLCDDSSRLVLSEKSETVDGFTLDESRTALTITEGGNYNINVHLLCYHGRLYGLIHLNDEIVKYFFTVGDHFTNASVNMNINIKPNTVFKITFQSGHKNIHKQNDAPLHHVQITRLGDL